MSDLYAKAIRVIIWDECLSMAILTGGISNGPPFLQVTSASSITLLDHTGEDLHADLKTLLDANPDKRIRIEFQAPRATLEGLGLTEHRGSRIRSKQLQPQKAPTVPKGMQLLTITSYEQDVWAGRVQIEALLFGYGSSHTDRLRVALRYMFANDLHYVVVVDDTVVAYMTIRYTRGMAYLQGAGVLEDYRRQGIARALLQQAVNDTLDRGYDTMITSGMDERAELTWTNLGFTNVVGPLITWTK